MRGAKHKVRRHLWINGELRIEEHILASLEEALSFAKRFDGEHIKIYNNADQMVHEVAAPTAKTYA